MMHISLCRRDMSVYEKKNNFTFSEFQLVMKTNVQKILEKNNPLKKIRV